MARELAIENGKLKSDLDANGNKVINLATPTSDNDAATKKYVDERPVPSPSWSDITNKPTAFPPEAHEHTNDSWFTTAIEVVKSWANNAFAARAHEHFVADVNGLQDSLSQITATATNAGALAAEVKYEDLPRKLDNSHNTDSSAHNDIRTALSAKVGSFAAVGGVTPSVSGGVADVSALFSGANTLLMNLIRNNSAQLALDDQGEIVVTMHTED